MKKILRFVREEFWNLLGWVLAGSTFTGITVVAFAYILPQTSLWFGVSCLATIGWTCLTVFFYKASKEPTEMHANAPAGNAILQLIIIAFGWMATVATIATLIRAYNLFF